MKREPALDGLRALAILFVVVFHAYPDNFPGGWIGVEIFFVLSGFLITSILKRELEKTGRVSYPHFYWRRILRLMPAVACLYAFELLRAVHSAHRSEILLATMSSALYFMNWSRAFDLLPHDVLGHTWSLSVEEQFYMVWPFILRFIYRRKPVLWLSAALCLVIAWRCWLVAHGASSSRTYNGIDTHADGLLIGGRRACAPARAHSRLALCCWPARATLAVLFAVAASDTPTMQMVGLAAAACCGAALVSGGLRAGSLIRVLSLRLLIFSGKKTNRRYLWHYPLLELARFKGVRGWRVGLVILISYLVAVCSRFLVELPFLKYRSREPFGRQRSMAGGPRLS